MQQLFRKLSIIRQSVKHYTSVGLMMLNCETGCYGVNLCFVYLIVEVNQVPTVVTLDTTSNDRYKYRTIIVVDYSVVRPTTFPKFPKFYRSCKGGTLEINYTAVMKGGGQLIAEEVTSYRNDARKLSELIYKLNANMFFCINGRLN